MEKLERIVEKVQTMDDFLDFLKKLIACQQRLEFSWKNYDLDPFLRGIGTAITDQMKEQDPSWYLFAKVLLDATTVDPEFG